MKKTFLLFFGLLYACVLVFNQSLCQFNNIVKGWTDLNISRTIKDNFSWQIASHFGSVVKQGKYSPLTFTSNPYHNLNQNIFRPSVHFQSIRNIRFRTIPRFLTEGSYEYNQYFSFEAGFLRHSFYRFNNDDLNNSDRNYTQQLNLILNNIESTC